MSCPRIDCVTAVQQISHGLRSRVLETLGRRGVVLGLSGGVDSSVSAALAAQALGPEQVFAVLMPEPESDPASLELGKRVAEQFGIPHCIEEIAPVLEAVGCYRRRDEAVRTVVPGFGTGWRCKLVHEPGGGGSQVSLPFLIVESPAGEQQRLRLPPSVYRAVVAATNFKQRVRKMVEYHHADRLHYAVLGTVNRLEYDQGFFVKGGDGLADVKPIAHLYKGQVYQLAEHLGVPAEIIGRPPTTDTWSLPQSQEEFFFGVPTAELDAALAGLNAAAAPEATAERSGLPLQKVERIYREILNKRHATRYLHLPPLLVEPVPLGGEAD